MPERAIFVLENLVIDHIAAGEVVERPASVVKELLENALDAGASAVDITLQQGGLSLLTVSDNGCGMSPQDATTCFLRHATSKLRHVQDLESIQTLGFRGEALSSIAAVARVTLTTRQQGHDVGYKVVMHGGTQVEATTIGCPKGTTIEVRDLFYNTPARRKFMRAATTEQAHCVDVCARTMLGARQGGLLLQANQRRLLDIPPTADLSHRCAAILYEKPASLLPFMAQQDNLKVSGFLALPKLERADTKGMWLFVNGRYVRDRLLQRAVVEAWRQHRASQNYPTVVLYLDLPPTAVDVNVHPQKLEVRFANHAAIFALVRQAILQALMQALSEQTALPTPKAIPSSVPQAAAVKMGPAQQAFLAHVVSSMPQPVVSPKILQKTPQDISFMPFATPLPEFQHAPVTPAPQAWQALAVVYNRYVLCQKTDALWLVDWQGLREAQALDNLLQQANNKAVETADLLFPEPLHAQAPWDTWLDTAWEQFLPMGLGLEPVAPLYFVVRCLPKVLAKATVQQVVQAFIEIAYEQCRKTPEDLSGALIKIFARCVKYLPMLTEQQARDDCMTWLMQSTTADLHTFASYMVPLRPTDIQRLLQQR